MKGNQKLQLFGGMALLLTTALVGCGQMQRGGAAQLQAMDRDHPCQPIVMLPNCYRAGDHYVLDAWDTNPQHCGYRGPLPADYKQVDYALCKDLPGYDPNRPL